MISDISRKNQISRILRIKVFELVFTITNFSRNCPKHANFAKFISRENCLESSIQRTPGYSWHFLQELQVPAIDRFDCSFVSLAFFSVKAFINFGWWKCRSCINVISLVVVTIIDIIDFGRAINPPRNHPPPPPPRLSCQAPPPLKSANCLSPPHFKAIPPLYWFFVTPPPQHDWECSIRPRKGCLTVYQVALITEKHGK